MKKTISHTHLQNLFTRFPELKKLEKNISDALDLLLYSIQSGGKILICGNGGSAADAEHITAELMKGFLLKRPLSEAQRKALCSAFPHFTEEGNSLADKLQNGIPTLSLVSGVALPTAYANDVAPDMIFAQQVFVLAKPEDIVWGISTSGNSANVNNALKIAKSLGCKTLGLSGKDGGAMSTLLDVELKVPAQETYLVQELHLPVYHTLCAILEAELFNE